MNIVCVADVSIKDVVGGAERVLYEQTSRLAKKGFQVSVITRRLLSHADDHEFIDRVHEFRYHLSRRNAPTFLLSSILNSRKIFLDLIKTQPVDLIYIHQSLSALGVLLTKASRRIGKVYLCLSLAFEEYETRRSKSFKLFSNLNSRIVAFFMKRFEKYVMSKSDSIIVLSEFTKNTLVENYQIKPEIISIIPGGVDLSKFSDIGNKPAAKKKLGLAEEKTLLFTVRNLVPRMGLESLICAMKEIGPAARDIVLVIGGEGALKSKLSQLISDLGLSGVVTLKGFIPEAELASYYQAADFFILPTRCLEGFGLVTVEAMACGTPVIGTPVGGTKEILMKFDPTFLFEDTTAASMTKLILEKIGYYKENPDDYQELSRRCRAFVEKNYSWEANVNSVEALFVRSMK
jgi:glycosyltransferase involved in cell wall biosynthesis